MFCPPRFAVLSLLASLLMSLLPDVVLHAQTKDGFTAQEHPGIALVKPQTWSKDSEVAVFEFEAFMDRRAVGAPNAGYYEFRTAQTPKRQIAASKVVKVIVYPTLDRFQRLVSASDREALDDLAKEIDQTIKSYSASRTYLLPHAKALQEEIARFDSGKVKVKGQWVARSQYEKQQAIKLSGVIRSAMLQAEPPSSFDLDSDPSYVGLKELAATNPDVAKIVQGIKEAHAQRVRAEKRANLLARLNSTNLDIAQAKIAVEQLRGLQPAEDPKATSFLKKWDAGVASVKANTAEASKFAEAMDAEMAAVPQGQITSPELSADLSGQITALNDTMTNFLASKPPQALIAESGLALAVCQINAGLVKLPAMFARKEIFQAKDLLDTLVRQSRQVGSHTERVLTAVQVHAAGIIEEFNRRRGEGEAHADSGKNIEALAAYQSALEIIPDAGVAAKADELRKSVEKPKQ